MAASGGSTGGAAAKKRSDYLSWDEYFMAVAFLAAKRSKDPSSQVGAVIVNEDKKIVGVGELDPSAPSSFLFLSRNKQ
jgi:deoxycytidylate deaminase